MMRNFIIFERLAQKAASVYVDDNFVELKVDGESAKLPRISSTDFRFCIDQCRYINKKVLCHGWAFQRDTTEPAKRIMFVYNGKLVAIAKPNLRVDVRQKLPINYDFCGFGLDFTPEQLVFDGEQMQILIFSQDGVVITNVECRSPLKSRLANVRLLEETGTNIKLTSDDGVSSFDFEKSKGIKFFVDSTDWDQPKLSVRGWCLLKRDLSCKLKVGVALKNKIILLPQACNRERPDVAQAFGSEGGDLNFGFQLSITLNNDDVVDSSDIKIIIIADQEQDPIGRVIPLFSSAGFLGRVYSKVVT